MLQPMNSLGSTMSDNLASKSNYETLDATGLRCPLPVLKARKRLKAMESGSMLRILATDPGSPADMAAFCESQGHTLESSSEEDGVYTLAIRKA